MGTTKETSVHDTAERDPHGRLLDANASENATDKRKLASTEPPEGSALDADERAKRERRDTLSALREFEAELVAFWKAHPGNDQSARELIVVRSAIRLIEADGALLDELPAGMYETARALESAHEMREALVIHLGRLERYERELTERFLLASDNPEEVHEDAVDRADARARTFGYADALHVQSDVYGECARELRRLLGIETQPSLPFDGFADADVRAERERLMRRNAVPPPAPVSFAPLPERVPASAWERLAEARSVLDRAEATRAEVRAALGPLSLVERARRAFWSAVLGVLALVALGCAPVPCTSSGPNDGSVAPAWDGSFAPDACNIAQAFAAERGCPAVDCAALIGTSSCEPSRVPLCLDALAQSTACPQEVLTRPVCAQLCSGGGS